MSRPRSIVVAVRARRSMAIVVGSTMVLLAVFGAVVLARPDRAAVTVATGPAPPSDSLSSNEPPTEAPPTVESSTTTLPARFESTGAIPTTATTRLVCRNRTDRRCGAFRWDPVPDDRPAQISVRVDPPSPRVNEPFYVYLTIDDPDRPLDRGSYAVQVAPLHIEHSCCPGWGPPAANCAEGFGPWDAPPPGPPGHVVLTNGPFERSDPGTYDIAGFYLPSSSGMASDGSVLPGTTSDRSDSEEQPMSCRDPYAGDVSQPIPHASVVVRAAASPTTAAPTTSSSTDPPPAQRSP